MPNPCLGGVCALNFSLINASYFILETAMSFYVDQDHSYWQVKYEDLNVGMQLTWGRALEPERKSSSKDKPKLWLFLVRLQIGPAF